MIFSPSSSSIVNRLTLKRALNYSSAFFFSITTTFETADLQYLELCRVSTSLKRPETASTRSKCGVPSQ